MREILSWGGDIGLLASILSTLALRADSLTWSALQERRGRGFGGGPHDSRMVLWDLMIGPCEAPVLNDLPLWEVAEVLLERRRLEFGGNGDNHLRVRRHCGRWFSRWRRCWRMKMLLLLISLQRLCRQCIFLVCPARLKGSS